MDKPFKTIDEQIDILTSRGVLCDAETPDVLRREGYYSVVNGYKDPFIDARKSAEKGEDVFKEGTEFSDIYALFSFDRSLRQTMFRYFAKAEATLKTQCAYHFMERHRGESEPYLNASNYDPRAKTKLVRYLIGDFETALGRNPDKRPKSKAYLEHYKANHDEVPLWVLLRYATLGQAFKFYCYQDESMRNRIAKGFAQLYADSYGEKITISPKRLRTAYDHIKDFRNICAHEERLYCARVSPWKNVSVMDVIQDLKLVLSKEDSTHLVRQVANLLVDVSGSAKSLDFKVLMASVGVANIQEVVQ